jgi:hypothetical protein
VFVIYYVNIAIGVVLLALDIRGVLRARGTRLVFLRLAGVAAAGVASLTPFIWWHGGSPLPRGSVFPLIAYAYLVLYAVFTAGSLLSSGSRPTRWAQRLAYAGLLVLSAIPSFVLLPLSAPMAIAGAALVRPSEPAGRPRGRGGEGQA